MPTYEYECTSCGHTFDQFQVMTAEPLKKCPKCKKKVRRLLGAGGGLIFKGSGFYSTDYRSPTYSEKANKDKESASAKTESTPAKTESAPAKTESAAKTESKPARSEKSGAAPTGKAKEVRS